MTEPALTIEAQALLRAFRLEVGQKYQVLLKGDYQVSQNGPVTLEDVVFTTSMGIVALLVRRDVSTWMEGDQPPLVRVPWHSITVISDAGD